MTSGRSVVDMVSKPWGFEKRIINTDQYCGKLLYIVKGKNTSLHFHKTKDETFYVHSGKIQVFYHDSSKEIRAHIDSKGERALWSLMNKVVLGPGDNFRLPPGRVHIVIASEDTELYEFSTAHDESDTVRFKGVQV